MNTYLPHIIGSIFLLVGFMGAKFHRKNKNSVTHKSIKSCWIDRAYTTD